jgi:hypothetical protein
MKTMKSRSSAIALILWDMRGKYPEICSRGSWQNVHGDEVLYLGCTPDRSAYFWIEPGVARWLSEDQLREAGFVLNDYRDAAGLRKLFDAKS